MPWRGYRLNELQGSWRNRVNIYTITETSDSLGAGGDREEVLFQAGVRCRIEDVSAREITTTKTRLTGDQLDMEITHKIVIYWIDGLKANMVIVDVDTGIRYQIIDIKNPDQRNEKYLLGCKQYEAYK